MAFKSTSEFDSALADLLTYIRDHDFDFYKYAKELFSTLEIDDLLEYAHNNGLVIGVSIKGRDKFSAGLIFELASSVRVTREGLEFIEKNN